MQTNQSSVVVVWDNNIYDLLPEDSPKNLHRRIRLKSSSTGQNDSTRAEAKPADHLKAEARLLAKSCESDRGLVHSMQRKRDSSELTWQKIKQRSRRILRHDEFLNLLI